jgi:RNA polymerase sigma-70 factor (ECF subfamily)
LTAGNILDHLYIHNESTLLRRLAQSDETAFRMIYDLYRKKISSFAFVLTKSEDMADEILQEVFVKLWLNRTKLVDVDNFNAWLHTIARNLVLDALKKIAREKNALLTWSLSAPAHGYEADQVIFSKENEKILQDAVQQLTPQQQEVYRLSKIQGLKNKEIASLLGISALTVKNHLVNAMRIIRHYFRHNTDLIIVLILLKYPH